MMMQYRAWMAAAVEQAEKSWAEGGIPIGAVLVDQAGAIVARGHNRRVQSSRSGGGEGGWGAGGAAAGCGDPTAHAEIECLRNAGRRRDWRELVLVSTLSPCAMCSGAAILFGIPRVIIGENETFRGAEDWMRRSAIDLVVLGDTRCIALMQRLKAEKPDLWLEDIGR